MPPYDPGLLQDVLALKVFSLLSGKGWLLLCGRFSRVRGPIIAGPNNGTHNGIVPLSFGKQPGKAWWERIHERQIEVE
jgi:hypothetical protein